MRGKVVELTDIDRLHSENVHVKDIKRVESLINTLINGGKDKLQVISDFDMTLTKQHENGKRCVTSFGIFEVSQHLPNNYREKSLDLFEKYYPIEVCPKMTVDEKIPHMIQWYKEAEKLLKGCHLTPEDIVQAVKETHTVLRDGAEDMMALLDKAGVPVLVLSAGVGDVVDAVLRKHSIHYPHVSIVSNFLKFSKKDEETVLEGFSGEFIHMFNKHTAGSGPNTCGETKSYGFKVSTCLRSDSYAGIAHTELLNDLEIGTPSAVPRDEMKLAFGSPVCTHVAEWLELYVDSEHSVIQGRIFNKCSRCHVILLGDCVGDADMAEVVQPCPEAVLKIGFLYEKCEERLPSFLEHFDMVLVDDQTMNVVNDLLRLIIEE